MKTLVHNTSKSKKNNLKKQNPTKKSVVKAVVKKTIVRKAKITAAKKIIKATKSTKVKTLKVKRVVKKPSPIIVRTTPTHYTIVPTIIKKQIVTPAFSKLRIAAISFLSIALIFSLVQSGTIFADATTQGTIIVTTNVTNADGGTKNVSDFTMNVAASNNPAPFAGSSSGVAVLVDPGTYSVGESPDSGYATFIPNECSGAIAAGEVVHCTITNDDITPQLKIITHVDSTNGGSSTAPDFTINVTATNPTASSFPGDELGGTIALSAGSFSVDEASTLGYQKTLSAGCSGTILVGEIITCTILNIMSPVSTSTSATGTATLIVKQNVINNDGGTRLPGDFVNTASGTNLSNTTFFGSASGTVLTLDPGPYSVTTDDAAEYASFLPVECSGTIAAGETKECTITSDDITPQLKVIVHVVNVTKTSTSSDFSIHVDAINPTATDFSGSETGGTLALFSGAYTVTEPDSLGYNIATSTDCTGTIGIGQIKTCTITNTDPQPIGGGGGGGSGTGGGNGNNGGGGSSGNGNVIIGSALSTTGTGTSSPQGTVAGASTDIPNTQLKMPEGEVLGASTELPRTGSPIVILVILAALITVSLPKKEFVAAI